jgi:hypothetical protein
VSGDKVEVIEEEESSHNMEENIKKRFEGGWRDMGGWGAKSMVMDSINWRTERPKIISYCHMMRN